MPTFYAGQTDYIEILNTLATANDILNMVTGVENLEASVTAASVSATNAELSAITAAASASSVGLAATTATNAASAANLSAITAGNSATAAGLSATTALAQATAAGLSATTATARASAAGLSATTASNAATAAGLSQITAGNSATAAGLSATTALAQATAAGLSATTAGNSATAAGLSATTALAQATAAGLSATTATNAASAALAVTIPWTYDSSTTMADPGSGLIRLNSATPSAVTLVAVDDLNNKSEDVSAFVITWDDSTNANKGTLTLRQGTSFAIYTVTALADNAGWTQLTVTYVTGSGTFSAATIFVTFARSGDKGADGGGAGDVTSNTAVSVDNEIVLFNSTTGKQIKRATTTGILKGTSGVISAATAGTDYSVGTKDLATGLLKSETATGTLSIASAGTDYVLPGGALGTPSSGTVTYLTGTASININGTVGATTPSTGGFTSLTASGSIVSTLAIGTAPFNVTSTTLCTNLNADLLDGNQASAFATASHSHTSTSDINATALGSGTANSTTYLRGDRTWQVVSSGDNHLFNYSIGII